MSEYKIQRSVKTRESVLTEVELDQIFDLDVNIVKDDERICFD